MMRQLINLYQDSLNKTRVPLHAGLMCGIIVSCGLLLSMATVFLFWQQGKIINELSRLRQDQIVVAANLQALKLENPARQSDPLLAQQQKQKQAELVGRKPLLAYLNNSDLGMVTGFSPVIRGFAEYPFRGVWLTGILLNISEHKILLSGTALQPDLIPAYVQHLGENKVLKDQSFASLKVTQTKEKSRQVDFLLESDFGVADE